MLGEDQVVEMAASSEMRQLVVDNVFEGHESRFVGIGTPSNVQREPHPGHFENARAQCVKPN
jgi:hypothetical protein